MRRINEKWCEWHVLVVEEPFGDDRQVTVMHPECGFTVTSDAHGVSFQWACQIQWEIDNAGFDTLLGDIEGEGWFRARMRHVTLHGPEWSEIDCEYEVEPVTLSAGGECRV